MPAATEIAHALGATDALVAVTHDCDYPPAVRALPRVTRSGIPEGTSSGGIETLVRTAAERGESTFHLDAAALHEARPDIILGQTLCEVCAVTLDQVPRELHADVVPLEADSLEGIFADVRRVAAALGREREGDALVEALRARLAAVERAIAGRARPRVACLEWLDPLYNAGHWVPEQVAIAGGDDVLGAPRRRSEVIPWERVRDAAPAVLVLMPCGFDARRALADAQALKALPGWADVPAVRARCVFAVDGNAYFSRPGPRVVDGAELLASLIHPGAVGVPRDAVALAVA